MKTPSSRSPNDLRRPIPELAQTGELRSSKEGPFRSLGYFAFPPDKQFSLPEIIWSAKTSDLGQDEEQCDAASSDAREQEARDLAWASRVKRDEELHKACLAREEVEARRGEESWVRSGGILQNPDGSRNMERTLEIRKELRLRDFEQALTTRWEAYERKWEQLEAANGSGRPVEFHELPWPVDAADPREIRLMDLQVSRIGSFLLDNLKVRGCTVTGKERIQSSMERWRPDHLTGILERVVDRDKEYVTLAIRVVMACLQQIYFKV